jgi:glycosyltransferase involved in cell wall biosynthesis
MGSLEASISSERPMASVITVSFNSERTIERTIRSVLGQTYPSVEYIVIDGGSRDGTVDIIRRYADRLAHWVSERDRGISHAFNKGIAIARGELIGIINSDDWYEPDAVQVAVSAFEERRPDVIFGDLFFPEIAYSQKGDADFGDKLLYRMPNLNHPTCFVSKQTYDRCGGYDESLEIAMDFELLRRCFLAGCSFHYTGRTMANMSLAGASSERLAKRYLEVLRVAGYHPRAFEYAMKNYLYLVRRAFKSKRAFEP